MNAIAERFNSLYQNQLNAARQWGFLSLEGGERLFRLQVENTRGLSEAAGQALQQMLAAREATGSAPDWSKLFEEGAQRAVDLTHAYVHAATEFQTEAARLLEEQLRELNRQFMGGVEELVRSAGAAAEAAAGAGRAAPSPEHKMKKAA